MRHNFIYAGLAILLISTFAAAQTTGKTQTTLKGLAISDGVSGELTISHGWLEVPIYAQNLKQGTGMGVRTSSNPQGGYSYPGDNPIFPSLASGKNALFILSYSDIPAFTRSDVNVREGSANTFDLRSPAYYSVMYNVNPSEWGASPYTTNGTDFYQTFIATGPHITRIGVKLGGKGGDHQILTLNYGIYEPNSGPPSTWKLVSPIRSRVFGKGVDPIIHIYHVIYRSSEINLTPGKMYAVRFWRDPSSPSPDFVLVVRKDNPYGDGILYQNGKLMPNMDAYAYISGGEPGTIVNHAPVGDLDLKEFAGGGQRFGQTFKASGIGLAGVDAIYADGSINPKSVPVKFQLYDKPGGTPIGPSKTCYAVSLTYQARAAAVWNRGEIKLTPGKMYYIEWSVPKGANTWVLNEDLPGDAYVDGKILKGKDLAMSIAEYDR